MIVQPVSYTHLDVYKRQVFRCQSYCVQFDIMLIVIEAFFVSLFFFNHVSLTAIRSVADSIEHVVPQTVQKGKMTSTTIL